VTAGLLLVGLVVPSCGSHDAEDSGSTTPGTARSQPFVSALPRLASNEGKDTSRGRSDPDGPLGAGRAGRGRRAESLGRRRVGRQGDPSQARTAGPLATMRSLFGEQRA